MRLYDAKQSHIEDISRRLKCTDTLARAAIFLVVDDPGTVRRWVAKYGGHLSRSQRTGVYQLIREYGSTDGGDRENGCGDGKADRLI